MGKWLEHTVITNVKAPVQQVWSVWSDLEAMPCWMTWIESVKTVDDESATTLPDLTEWTLAANGFRFTWKAQITERIDGQKLEWVSVGGLPTKGAARFYQEEAELTAVKLSVSYELPKALAPLMEARMLSRMVTNELQNNLDRFRDLVESGYNSSIIS